MVVARGADTTGFDPDAFLSWTVNALVVGVGGVSASATKACCADVLESFILDELVEDFAVAVDGVETGMVDLSARVLLPSSAELPGEVLSGGVAGEEASATRLAPGDLLVFLLVSFEEFIFKFT
jgi:hypothetical protein